MKLYKATLNPESSFATPLKGDTIFGQLCWMIYFRWKEKFNGLLENYKNDKPFLIVSDAFPTGYLPKPKLPSHCLGEDSRCKKENRKKIWLTPDDLRAGEYTKAKKAQEVTKYSDRAETLIKNSINYCTFTTDEGKFAPYSSRELYIGKKDVYFLLDEDQLSLENLRESLEFLGLYGYGKDSSTGKGRFSVDALESIEISQDAKNFMTLSPIALKRQESIESVFYEPFVRFGKFGGELVYVNPFKKPILFMDTGAVIVYKDKETKQYDGTAITNIAISNDTRQQASVQQGYAILYPLKDVECKQSS